MDTAIIIASILAAAAIIFFAFYLDKRKRSALRKAEPIRLLRAAINYTSSCMASADGDEYAVIHITVTNNSDDDMENVGITWSPLQPLINVIHLNNSVKIANIPQHELKYESLTLPIRVAKGFVTTGYLVYRSADGTCPVDELRVVANEHAEILPVHKEWIKKSVPDMRSGKDSSWTT